MKHLIFTWYKTQGCLCDFNTDTVIHSMNKLHAIHHTETNLQSIYVYMYMYIWVDFFLYFFVCGIMVNKVVKFMMAIV